MRSHATSGRFGVVHLGPVVVEERVVRAGVVVAPRRVPPAASMAPIAACDAPAADVPSSSEQWISAALPA